MASDKNNYLQIAARLAKQNGAKKFIAVTPIEHDLAWSEDSESYYEKTVNAEKAALEANPDATIIKTNLTFGPSTLLVHYLAQCALVGKCPYNKLLTSNNFKFRPVHTDDLAVAVSKALEDSRPGRFTLSGPEQLTLKEIVNIVEKSAGKLPNSTKNPMLPPFDYVWDFFFGTSADVNMSRMVEFLEQNTQIEQEFTHDQFGDLSLETKLGDYFKEKPVKEEDYAHPTMFSYRLTNTD